MSAKFIALFCALIFISLAADPVPYTASDVTQTKYKVTATLKLKAQALEPSESEVV
jgi:hypothetical protein